jgi:hypothetical protein
LLFREMSVETVEGEYANLRDVFGARFWICKIDDAEA